MAQRLSGAILARFRGEEHAAAELKVDRATVRRWLKRAPEDGWQLTHDLAEARLQEQLASGKLSAAQLATVQGVAARNLRYSQLIAQREARRQAQAEAEPEPDPVQALVDSLDDRRGRLLGQHIRLVELQRQSGEAPEPAADDAGEDVLAEFVAHLRDLPDAEVDEALAWTEQAIATAHAELEAHYREVMEQGRLKRATWEVATALEGAEPSPASQEPVAMDSRRRPAAHQAVVIGTTGHHLDDHPSWRPAWRQERSSSDPPSRHHISSTAPSWPS